MVVLLAFSDINFQITVAVTLFSTGVVGTEDPFRISFAVTCEGERVECSECCLQADSKCY